MIPAVLLLVIVVAYRVVSGMAGSNDFAWLHNFAPVAAIALCGAVYLPRRFALFAPIAMLAVSDIILNVFHYHQPLLTWEILPRYVALLLIGAIGFAIRRLDRGQSMALIGGSLVTSVLFYVITNTGSWLGDPGYAKTGADWVRALTTGLPGYPPTWTFYKHTLASDLIFTLLFVGCMSFRVQAASADRSVTAAA